MLDSQSEKYLFHRGQAQVALFNIEQAIQDFQTVLKINTFNLVAQQQIEYCHEQIKERDTNQKNYIDLLLIKHPSKNSNNSNRFRNKRVFTIIYSDSKADCFLKRNRDRNSYLYKIIAS